MALKSEEVMWTTLGHVSAVFMSNPQPGTEQIMPEQEIRDIGEKFYVEIKTAMAEEFMYNFAQELSKLNESGERTGYDLLFLTQLVVPAAKRAAGLTEADNLPDRSEA